MRGGEGEGERGGGREGEGERGRVRGGEGEYIADIFI